MDELTEYLANSAEDGFWEQIQSEARQEAEREPMLVSFLYAAVLRHATLEDGLSVILANKLADARTLRDSAPRPDQRSLRRRGADSRLDPRRSPGRPNTRPGRPRLRATRSCTTRASTRSRPTASPTGSGVTSGMPSPPTSKTASPKSSASTSIRPPASAAASSSIMARASSSARPPSSKTTSRSSTKSRSAAPAKRPATATPRSAAACSSARAQDPRQHRDRHRLQSRRRQRRAARRSARHHRRRHPGPRRRPLHRRRTRPRNGRHLPLPHRRRCGDLNREKREGTRLHLKYELCALFRLVHICASDSLRRKSTGDLQRWRVADYQIDGSAKEPHHEKYPTNENAVAGVGWFAFGPSVLGGERSMPNYWPRALGWEWPRLGLRAPRRQRCTFQSLPSRH